LVDRSGVFLAGRSRVIPASGKSGAVTLSGRFHLIRGREDALAPAHGHMRVQETEALLKTVEK